MRLQGKDYKEEKEKMEQEDEIVELKYHKGRLKSIKKKYPEAYEEIKDKSGKEYRFTKIEINEQTTEYLISNISKEEFSKNELKEIHGNRWKI